MTTEAPAAAPSTGLTILEAAWRYRWVVLLSIVLAVAGGVYWQERQDPLFSATSSLVVDPLAARVPGETATTPISSRFLADQVVILRSPRVAERAAELAAQTEPAANLATRALLAGSEIAPSGDSNLITIRFTAGERDVAILGANSLAIAYQDVRRSDLAANAAAAIDRLDALIASVDEELVAISAAIDELRTGATQAEDPVLEALERQLRDALEELVDLQGQRVRTTDPEALGRIRTEIDDIAQQLALFRSVRSLDEGTPEAQGLLADQAAAIDRRSQLRERRDTLAVDAELVSSGVTSFLPAQGAAQLGNATLLRTLIAMIVFGGLIGVGLAYLLSLRRRDFIDRKQPELLLGAPLLADIPEFEEEGIDTQLPVRTHIRSATAEAFRFGIAALDIRLPEMRAHSVGVVSGIEGDGKSTIAANLALVASRLGTRVLLVDADFGAQALSRLVAPDQAGGIGMTDVTAGKVALSDAVQRIRLTQLPKEGAGYGSGRDEGMVYYLSRGTQSITAVDFFRSQLTRGLFNQLRDAFDLVIIDTPPILQVAYASVVARNADALALVVPHGSAIDNLQELIGALRLIDRPIAGYFYNRAPLRHELTLSAGSLQDVVGDWTPAVEAHPLPEE